MECIPEYMPSVDKGEDKEEVRGEFVVVRTLPSLLYGAYYQQGALSSTARGEGAIIAYLRILCLAKGDARVEELR